jgi:hypothetical protein
MIIVPTVRGFIKASAPKPTLTFDAPPTTHIGFGGAAVTVFALAHVAGGPFWAEWASGGGLTSGGFSVDKVTLVSGMNLTNGMTVYGYGSFARATVGTFQASFNIRQTQTSPIVGSAGFTIVLAS